MGISVFNFVSLRNHTLSRPVVSISGLANRAERQNEVAEASSKAGQSSLQW
jgi:hypothetical protein